MPLYQHACSERRRALDALVADHTQRTTFEGFVARLRDPVPPAPERLPDQNAARLANALIDHGASSFGACGEPHSVSPRPTKRLGPFKRPPQPAVTPQPGVSRHNR